MPTTTTPAPTTTTTPATTTPAPTTATPTTTSSCCGSLFQGSLLPSVTTTQQQQTTTPQFYTDYLQNIANLGQNAVTQGGVAGPSALQQQAYQMAPCAAFAGAGTLGAASTLQGLSGSTAAPNIVQNYMNPYTQSVVNEMARLQQQNIQQNVLPSLASVGASTGNFGSQRQQQALGQTMANMQANLTGQQYGALNTGYQNAMQQAQTDLQRALNAGTALGTTGMQQNALAQSGLNELSTLGGQQQTTAQNMLNYPMTQAQNYANLLHGYQIPTGVTTQTVAPGQQGEFTNSPLSQIAGLASLISALYPSNSNASQQTAYANQANLLTTQNQQAQATLNGLKFDSATGTMTDSGGVNHYTWDATTNTYKKV
jgi:hypothetical protein